MIGSFPPFFISYLCSGLIMILDSRLTLAFLFAFVLSVAPAALAQQSDSTGSERPSGFEWEAKNAEADSNWEFKDPKGWAFQEVDGQRVLHQHLKSSAYKPPHRSPTHIALLKDRKFESFQLDVELKSTHPDYPHRDVCLFLCVQNPGQFYYVHLGKAMDPHANQIFIVNKADRTKISETTTEGTPWDEKWHHVRIRRDFDSGRLEVFFDDMEKPAMTANDKSFGAGQIGFGSFDDTAAFRKLTVRPLQK